MPDLGISVLLKGQNFMRMLAGLGVALKISLISVVISIPLGIVLGVLMTWKNPITKAILRIYLEIVRIMPQMVLLFLVFFGTTRAFGWDLSGENASIIVFTFWGAAEMSDLVRGALISIPKHQYESSEALGLSKVQTYWYIIIPQTLRRLIPLSINLITRMIKTTRASYTLYCQQLWTNNINYIMGKQLLLTSFGGHKSSITEMKKTLGKDIIVDFSSLIHLKHFDILDEIKSCWNSLVISGNISNIIASEQNKCLPSQPDVLKANKKMRETWKRGGLNYIELPSQDELNKWSQRRTRIC